MIITEDKEKNVRTTSQDLINIEYIPVVFLF